MAEVFHATAASPTRQDVTVDEGIVILLVGLVLAASLVVALGAARTGLPVLVAFLALGMLLGSEGPGGIEFDDSELARRVGMVGLALILYEGGLQTSWRRLRQVAVPAALLSTVGVVVSALLTGVAAYVLFDLSWLESVLLGAVVAATDAAAVFATLRFTHIRRTLARTLEAESGGNDPMGIALTLGLIAWIERPDSYGIDDLLLLVVQQIGLGLLVGVALGAVAIWVFGRLPHSIGAFAPVASVAAGALSFGAADVIGGSGFLAVYLVGLAVGSTPSRYRRQLVAFHEGLAFLAQVAIFVVFGLLVFPSELRDVALPGLALALLLMLVIRPAAVLASTLFTGHTESRPAAARLGRPPRGGADRARDVRALLGRAAQGHDLQRRLLRRRRLDDRPGHDARVGRRAARPARTCPDRPRGAARGRAREQARPRGLHGRRRPRDRRLGRPGARAAEKRTDRGRDNRGTTRSRRAGAPCSSRATTCSCSSRASSARISRTSSRAGAGASDHGRDAGHAVPGTRNPGHRCQARVTQVTGARHA